MKILFLHGWHSVAGGVKPTYLINRGHHVIDPQLDDDDFEIAIRTAQQAFDFYRPDVIVGSSRGGAIAMNLQSETTPMVLLCPAWKRWGKVSRIKPNTIVLHSRADDVIPFEESLELVDNSGLQEETLVQVGMDHRLADETSLGVLLWACEALASGIPLPWQEVPDSESLSNRTKSTAQNEGSYLCDACGEEIVIPLDLCEGAHQTYVEDCPVCCRANVIHVQFGDDGTASVWAELEQDAD